MVSRSAGRGGGTDGRVAGGAAAAATSLTHQNSRLVALITAIDLLAWTDNSSSSAGSFFIIIAMDGLD